MWRRAGLLCHAARTPCGVITCQEGRFYQGVLCDWRAPAGSRVHFIEKCHLGVWGCLEGWGVKHECASVHGCACACGEYGVRNEVTHLNALLTVLNAFLGLVGSCPILPACQGWGPPGGLPFSPPGCGTALRSSGTQGNFAPLPCSTFLLLFG